MMMAGIEMRDREVMVMKKTREKAAWKGRYIHMHIHTLRFCVLSGLVGPLLGLDEDMDEPWSQGTSRQVGEAM